MWRKEIIDLEPEAFISFVLHMDSQYTVVGFKLSGHFKFFFDIINVRVTFLDAKGPIK